jgi:hypothetical protein
MRFGLNKMSVGSVTFYKGGPFTVHFKCRDFSVPLYVNRNTDRRLVANLKYALEIEGQFSLSDLGSRILQIEKELWVFLHYHSEVPQGRSTTFLHIPGTLQDGAVFDIYNCEYTQYDDGNGNLVYMDPSTAQQSIVKRSAEYMKGPNVRPKGTIVKT